MYACHTIYIAEPHVAHRLQVQNPCLKSIQACINISRKYTHEVRITSQNESITSLMKFIQQETYFEV
jgi:hypothetical protein